MLQQCHELQSVANVRGLGGIACADGRMVRPGLLYRGGSLDKLSAADAQFMATQLGISCVIDVRCGWECAEKPDRAIPGAQYLHIPFYDNDIVGLEYIEPAAGTHVVGRDVACNPLRFYGSLSNPLTAGQIRRGLAALFAAASEGRGVFVHCSGGKDRAGILVLMALEVLGAERAAILEDYLLTNVSRDKNYRSNFERFLRFADGDEELAAKLTEEHRAQPENLQAFYRSVDERYGSMGAFISCKLGIGEKRIHALRAVLTEGGSREILRLRA